MLVCDTGPLVAAALSAPIVAEVGYLLAAKAGAAAESAFLRSLAAGDFTPSN